MHRLVLLLASMLLMAGSAAELEAQRRCTKGKPCGNSCIARDKVCRIGTGTARSSTSGAAGSTARTDSPSAPPGDARFVASSRGSVYYPIGCSAATDLSPANRIYFKTEEAARQAGYSRTMNRSCAGLFGASASRDSQPDQRPTAIPPHVTRALCVVVSITDGDTFTCQGGRRVRLLLIDAPEMDQGPFGARAKAHLERLLPLRYSVDLHLDVQKEDQYGRTLAYVVRSEGTMVNEEMVRAGYAVVSVYPPNVLHVERIRAAAEAAQKARRGLWSTSAFACSPADHRAGRCR